MIIYLSLPFFFPVSVNSISNSRFRGDYYRDGCVGSVLARVILFLSFLFVFGSVIAGAWIMIALYIIPNATSVYPGVAVFLQSVFIFARLFFNLIDRKTEIIYFLFLFQHTHTKIWSN